MDLKLLPDIVCTFIMLKLDTIKIYVKLLIRQAVQVRAIYFCLCWVGVKLSGSKIL